MTGGITAVKNTLSDLPYPPRFSRQQQLHRLQQVVRHELTPLQRQTLLAYHLQGKTIPQIARERGVQKSTVSRTLRRAETRVRTCLKY